MQNRVVPDRATSYHWPLFLLLIILLAGRLLLFVAIGPQLYFDSQTYVAPAIAMLENHGYDDFSFWDGSRTPVYPVFLSMVFALFGMKNYQAVVVTQVVLGMTIAIALYCIGFHVSRDRRIAFVCGLVYALDLSSAAFEHAILTETLATLLLCVTVLVALCLLDRPPLTRRGMGLLGLLAGLLVLCRPVFVLYPILLIGMVLLGFRILGYWVGGKRRAVGRVAAFLLPVFLLVGSWTFRNFVKYDYIGITTLLGSNLTQHVGMVMEKAPKEYADLASIYIKYRQRRIEESGTHVFTVGYAYEEMMGKTGLSFSQLSKALTKLSIALILREPKLYVKSVVRAFVRFWSPTVYYTQIVRAESLFSLAHSAYRVWHFAMLLSFFTGVVYVIAAFDLLSFESSYMLRRFTLMIAVILTTIFYVATVSSVLEYGENARYKAPVQPLIYVIVPLAYSYRQMARRAMKMRVT